MRELNRCSRCGKEFNNFQIEVLLETKTSRLKENKLWEHLPNLSIKSREVLCRECFELFSKSISDGMKLSEGQ